jgi:hypothetical protein
MYPIGDFLKACKHPGTVRVLKTALDTAHELNLRPTSTSILEWLAANDSVQKPRHQSTRVWENNWDPTVIIWVDAFNFFSGPDYCYLAYMKGSTGTWLLKSLKRSTGLRPVR